MLALSCDRLINPEEFKDDDDDHDDPYDIKNVSVHGKILTARVFTEIGRKLNGAAVDCLIG